LKSELNRLKESTLEKMKLCSFTLDCNEFTLDFVEKNRQEVVKLLSNKNEFYSLFHMPTDSKYYLKLSINKKDFIAQEKKIKHSLEKKFLLYAVLIALLSLLFSFYTLHPLKKALKINEEFIKDILHDYNTPISSLLINFKLLKKEIGTNNKINRMQNSIDTMLMLQNNLKYFLENSSLQKEIVELKEIINQRVDYFKVQYPKINFYLRLEELKIKTNKDAFIRIIDNLLSNACKYNIENGFIKIYNKNNLIYIENSTTKIKNPSKIFDRYYKENQRGLGIGLDIVKKLSIQLDINIEFEIKNTNIATFIMDVNKVTLK